MTYISEAIREAVRHRALSRCEYCQKPDRFSGISYQVDHIIALKHKGTSELENLAWACFRCNNSKGSDVAFYDDLTHELTPLFNPRLHLWDDHFILKPEGVIEGKTNIGRVTVDLLQVNHPEQITTRFTLIENDLW